MRYRLSIVFLFVSLIASAHTWQVKWGADARFAGSSGQYMPFWARTGEDGILPVTSSGLVTLGSDLSYKHSNGLFFETGLNVAGALAAESPMNSKAYYAILDRLYMSGGWKMLIAPLLIAAIAVYLFFWTSAAISLVAVIIGVVAVVSALSDIVLAIMLRKAINKELVVVDDATVEEDSEVGQGE